jgi:hypothetical protein
MQDLDVRATLRLGVAMFGCPGWRQGRVACMISSRALMGQLRPEDVTPCVVLIAWVVP